MPNTEQSSPPVSVLVSTTAINSPRIALLSRLPVALRAKSIVASKEPDLVISAAHRTIEADAYNKMKWDEIRSDNRELKLQLLAQKKITAKREEQITDQAQTIIDLREQNQILRNKMAISREGAVIHQGTPEANARTPAQMLKDLKAAKVLLRSIALRASEKNKDARTTFKAIRCLLDDMVADDDLDLDDDTDDDDSDNGDDKWAFGP